MASDETAAQRHLRYLKRFGSGVGRVAVRAGKASPGVAKKIGKAGYAYIEAVGPSALSVFELPPQPVRKRQRSYDPMGMFEDLL